MSTTLNKLEYLDETKGQIKTALNQFGSQITDEDPFRSYVDKINDIYTNWEKVTDEGTEVTLTPTKKGKLSLGIKGNTEQESTNGNQLVNYTNMTLTSNTTLNFTNDVLTVANTTGSYRRAEIDITELIKNNAGKTIKFKEKSYSSNDVELNPATQLTITKTDTTKQYAILRAYRSNTSNTYTIPNDVSNISNVLFQIYVNNTSTSGGNSLVLTEPLLYFDNNNTYEPYTYGPSPNPNYEQPIKSVTGENEVVVKDGNNNVIATKTLDLGDIQLNKIGTYKDVIFKNNPRNPLYNAQLDLDEWYVHSVIGNVTYTGASGESWNYNSTTSSFVKYNPFQIINKTDYSSGTKLPEILSNYYKPVKFNDFINGISGLTLYYANDTLQMRLSSSETTVEDFKTWLSTHNIEIKYPLANPTDIEITDTTLISQLEEIDNLYSNNGTTIITSTYENGNAQMIINASALKKGSE